MPLIEEVIEEVQKCNFNKALVKASVFLYLCKKKLKDYKYKIKYDPSLEVIDLYNNFLIDLYSDERVKKSERIIEKAANGIGYYGISGSEFTSMTLQGLRGQHVINEELYNVSLPNIVLKDHPMKDNKTLRELRHIIIYINHGYYNRCSDITDYASFNEFVSKRTTILLEKANGLLRILAYSDIPIIARSLAVKALIVLANEVCDPYSYSFKDRFNELYEAGVLFLV